MKVKELIEKLKGFPKDANIYWEIDYLSDEPEFQMTGEDDEMYLNINFDNVDYDTWDECPHCGC